MNRAQNWLTIAVIGLCANLCSIAAAQATDIIATTPIAATSTVDRSQPQHRVAIRKKKLRKRKIKKTIAQSAASSPPEFAQTPPVPSAPSAEPTPVVPPPPPAPPELNPPPVAPPKPPAPNPPQIIAPSQFSTTTKLRGQVVFGVTGTISGDYARNTTVGQRTRLEFASDINGGTLTTRLQAIGAGLYNQSPNPGTRAIATPEGTLGWTDGTTTNSITIDQLKYDFALSPQTQILVSANASAADDFTDTINPYFDGGGTDGAYGAVSLFGNRPSIYFTIQGTGVGIRHKLSDTTELSLGYLARSGNNPTSGNGLFGGGYGALAQLTFQTGENSRVGVTYIRSFNSDFGTGSTNANLGGLSNNYGLAGSVQLTPQLTVGGWAGYTQNQATGGDRQIWNWAMTAAAPDLGGKGNLAGLLIGQEPRVTASDNGTTDTKAGLHIEGFYQFKINENVSITPGIIYLTAPNQDANSSGAVIGALRTTFSF